MLIPTSKPVARRINPLRMKTMNTASLLTLLREQGPLSRSDLARISRLSKPTVSEQVADLISRGYVVETGQSPPGARRGKKPTLLEFNAGCGRVIAARISADHIQVREFSLDGSVTHQATLPIRPSLGPDFVIGVLKEAIRPILQRSAVAPGRRLIAIAAPGLVDVVNGIVLETDNLFGWRNVSLGADLGWEFGIPVVVDNDTNFATLAEARYGGGRGEPSFVVIQLDTGIGLGAYINGAPYHGRHWAGGEIAHMVPNPALISSPTGGRGHLESAVAMDRVEERVRELAAAAQGPLPALLESNPPLQALLLAAERGDAPAAEYVRELTRTLAAAITNVSACFDPGKIILIGPLFSALFGEIRAAFESVFRWPVKLELSGLGEDVALRGALVAGLARIHDRLEIELESPLAAPPAGAPVSLVEEGSVR